MLAGEFGSRREGQSGFYNQKEAGKCPPGMEPKKGMISGEKNWEQGEMFN